MDKEKLDELWKQVEHIGKIERLEYDAMVALGSVFGQMRSEIERLQNELTGYKLSNQSLSNALDKTIKEYEG